LIANTQLWKWWLKIRVCCQGPLASCFQLTSLTTLQTFIFQLHCCF